MIEDDRLKAIIWENVHSFVAGDVSLEEVCARIEKELSQLVIERAKEELFRCES